MASSESSSPPGSSDVKPPLPGISQPAGDMQAATTEQRKEVSPESVFLNSEPIREDQVQNAMKFLSHPKVRVSPVVHRRNFLERKGLTKDEIDEAFRRVPDPSPGANTSGQSTSTDGQMKPSSAVQQNNVQAIQPGASSSSGVISVPPRQFHWSHALLAIGFLAASGAGTVVIFKKTIIPRFKSWIRGIISNEDYDDTKRHVMTPSLEQEVAQAAKSSAAAAADLAKISQDMVIEQNKGNRYLEEFMTIINSQIQEMKSMKASLAKLEGKQYNAGRSIRVEEEYQNGYISQSKRPLSNGGSDFDSRSVRSISPPIPTKVHPKSYAEIMAQVQRGGPRNVRDVDDLPPSFAQPVSNPSFTSRAKSWETPQPPNYTSYSSQSPYPSEGSSSLIEGSGFSYQVNDNAASAQGWQQKNVRITDLENDTGSNGTAPLDWPPQRKWVPPQPPPVAMPEAAEAIRRTKSTSPSDQPVNAKSPPDDNEVDELQRITRISESGGQEEVNGEGLAFSSGEIHEEPVGS